MCLNCMWLYYYRFTNSWEQFLKWQTGRFRPYYSSHIVHFLCLHLIQWDTQMDVLGEPGSLFNPYLLQTTNEDTPKTIDHIWYYAKTKPWWWNRLIARPHRRPPACTWPVSPDTQIDALDQPGGLFCSYQFQTTRIYTTIKWINHVAVLRPHRNDDVGP